ncbi:MAG: hypothetical protein M1827_005828 [Pycnora praestabilis]|nr:MAG: hypothetical protein M1827_005828 [Pycnora praestabilis]
MDQGSSPPAPPRPSGIPRLSRLPVPRAAPPYVEKRLYSEAPPLVSALPSLGTSASHKVNVPASSSISRTSFSHSNITRKISAPKPSISDTASNKDIDRNQGNFKQHFVRPPSRQGEGARTVSRNDEYPIEEKGIYEDALSEEGQSLDNRRVGNGPILRKSRPSISERTIETLSQIPPSPSPRRRQSSFYSSESPMRPPSRAASAMGNGSRPGSSIGNYRSITAPNFRPASPTKRSALGGKPLQTPSSGVLTPSKRSASSTISWGPPPSLSKPVTTSGMPYARSKVPGEGFPVAVGQALPTSKEQEKVPHYKPGSKSLTARASKPRPPLRNVTSVPSTENADSSIQEIRRAITPRRTLLKNSNGPLDNGSIAPRTSKSLSKPPTASDVPSANSTRAEDESPKNFKSSNALRETIAKAKAARRMMAKQQSSSTTSDTLDLTASNPVAPGVSGFNFDFSSNPTNQEALSGSNRGLLQKRIDAARTDGRLNISAMGLTKIPDEVMSMYDFDSADAASGAWYESVDLVRFLAADNEIEEIGDNVFPVFGSGDGGMTESEEERGNQFGGLETLDLHGNLLRNVPLGLQKLQRLATLGLSNNKLECGSLEIISQISSLRELRLANNAIVGDLPESIGTLVNLEVLDLHGNALNTLPESLGALSRLRVLNVAENRFKTLPRALLKGLSLVELIASKNILRGSLFPGDVEDLSALQTLDVTNNSLTDITESSMLCLPALQQLYIGINHIAALPDISSWENLLTLIADDNELSTIPDGFMTLPKLRNVDFTGNNLKTLDDHIGLMENLEIFNIANNPLRNRKFLSMSTTDLKRDLRSRLAPEEREEPSDDVGESFKHDSNIPGVAISGGWPVKPGGVLDLSSRGLMTLDTSDLEVAASQHEIRSVILHHNHLPYLPPNLHVVGDTLSVLNLAHNELRGDALMGNALSFRFLRDLDLSSNTITSLTPLLTYLEAPMLQTLNVSINRITTIPVLRAKFENLTTLLASDNSVTDIDVEAVDGLRIFDVARNDIGHLPPRLGLLGGYGEGKTLKVLEVSGNRFRVPRYTLLEKGTEATLAWLRDRIPVEETEVGDVD